MSTVQLLLLIGGLTTLIYIGYAAYAGPSVSKASQRRLQAVRYRHSESTDAKVESQLKKAIAARKPKMHRIAGSGSRLEALQGRLVRSGKRWTVTQYVYASVGVALVIAVILFLRTNALLLSLVVGSFFGLGLPHFVVNRAIKKRTEAFNAKFPDAIELLVRGLRSGLPVTAAK